MRPIHLSMTAFGPFAGNEEIHFEDLGSNPLFLINGPTGSGKTTILDAICFALYGKSTGDEREGAQMRCDLASPDILTQVSFSFELNGKKFKISRIPEQEQAKKRGEGVTVRSAQAELVELEPNGEQRPIVAKKVKEATLEIENLTGLNADQFRQVMVLPQGKFRQLLMAESKDREQIFSNLFQTQIYKTLEDDLKLQASDIRKEVEKQRNSNQTILEAVDLESTEQLDLELTGMKPDWEKAQLQKEKDDQNLIRCNNNLQAGENLQSLFSNLDHSKSLLQSLLKEKPEQDTKHQRLKDAETATRLRPVFIEVDRCQKEQTLAITNRDLSKSEKDKAQLALEKANEQAEEIGPLSTTLESLKKDLISLNDYSARAVRLSPLKKARLEGESLVSLAEKNLKSALEKQAEINRSKEESEKNLLQLQQSQTEVSEKQAEFQKLTADRKRHQELQDNYQKATELETKLSIAENEGRRLLLQYQKLDSEHKSLEIAWHKGQAAILAQELKIDTPCPVCGSVDHPNPASSSEELPTETQIEKSSKSKQFAFDKLDKARESYREIKSNRDSLLVEIDKIKNELGRLADFSNEEMDTLYNDRSKAIQDLKRQQNEIQMLTQRILKLKSEEQKSRENLSIAQQEESEKKAVLAAAIAKEEAAYQEIPEKYRQTEILTSTIAAKQKEIKRQEQLISDIQKNQQKCIEAWTVASTTHEAAIETYSKSESALMDAKEKWRSTLATSPFSNEEAYQSVLLEQHQIQDLKKEIQTYDSDLNHLKGALQQQEKTLDGKTPPNLKQLKKELEEAGTKKELTDKHWQQLNSRMNQLETASKKIGQGTAKQKLLEEEYALVGTLSEIANGQTGNKISLQRFVLSVLLDDVLVEASHRLKLMSKGRYQLFRKEDRSKGNKASGLDLIVEDAYTGKVRPIATLSGGESFMAALALALGLSDIVQSYAGGIRLDTLFIDEGFGSLDPESLDLAIRTLIDLQSSGRMIGLISHVSDLKELLPTRIDLISNQNGSRIKIVTP